MAILGPAQTRYAMNWATNDNAVKRGDMNPPVWSIKTTKVYYILHALCIVLTSDQRYQMWYNVGQIGPGTF